MKIYTLENDYLFKKIFSNQRYLKQLLIDLFDIKANKIDYLNTTLVKTNKNGKVGIVDILLSVDSEIVILELQNIDRHNFCDRLLFYSSNIITNHGLKEGEDYENLRSVKVYAIINYPLFNSEIKNSVKLKVKNKIFTKKLEYQIFDLTKVDKSNKDNKYYELVNLFNVQNIGLLDTIIKSKIYKEMLEEIKNYNLDSEEYKKMEDIEKLMMNETEHYDTAYKVGKREGKIEGKREGKNARNIEIAKNLINENVDINIIMSATGLSKEQINALV